MEGVTSEDPSASRRDVIATLAIVGVFAALAVGRPIVRKLVRHPTRERCAAMLDRYADQESIARERGPSGVHVAIDAPDVTKCVSELTDAEVECAMGAGYVDAIERCLP